jgi:hypothetical protein
LFPFVLTMSKHGFYMKTLSKNSIADVLANPISRNLILILVTTLFVATAIVTASIILYFQW